jgi:hypothetical protein
VIGLDVLNSTPLHFTHQVSSRSLSEMGKLRRRQQPTRAEQAKTAEKNKRTVHGPALSTGAPLSKSPSAIGNCSDSAVAAPESAEFRRLGPVTNLLVSPLWAHVEKWHSAGEDRRWPGPRCNGDTLIPFWDNAGWGQSRCHQQGSEESKTQGWGWVGKK